MTLLSIAQAAADEIQIARPASIVGNTSPDAQRFLRYANKVGRELLSKAAWQTLRKVHTFTALGQETQTGMIPSDLKRFVPETMFNRTDQEFIAGPVSAVRWQSLKATGVQNAQRVWAFRGSDVLIYPALTGGQTLAFEYFSTDWISDAGGTPKATFTVDTDTPDLDEEVVILGVIYHWLRSEGQPWQAALADYRMRIKELMRQDQPRGGVVTAGDMFGTIRHDTGEPRTEGTAGSDGVTWGGLGGTWGSL